MKIKNIFKDFLSALLSGMLIGLAGMCFVLCKSNSDHGQLLGAFIFPFGLFLICCLKINLFTGKIGFALDDDTLTISRLAIMLISNLIGATLIGLCARLTFNSNELVLKGIEGIAKSKTNITGINSPAFLVKSILCGMMVYLAVYLFKKEENGFLKFIFVLIPIFFFVYLGFEHCIADMFYFTFANIFTRNMLFAMIMSIVGNSIGAIVLHYILKLINSSN